MYGFEVNKIIVYFWEVKYVGLNLKICVIGCYLILSVSVSGLVCKLVIGLLGFCNQGLLELFVFYYLIKSCFEGSFMFNVSGNQFNNFYYVEDLLFEMNVFDSKNKI